MRNYRNTTKLPHSAYCPGGSGHAWVGVMGIAYTALGIVLWARALSLETTVAIILILIGLRKLWVLAA